MRIYILLLSFFFCTYSAIGQVTFTDDVAPIIYENCTSCHRAGEIGPISLTNYEEVKSWGNMIKYVTEIGYMPPWSPDPEYRHLLNERVLSEEQKQTLAEWVDNGMLQGDPANEPDIPSFPTGSQIGTPDIVLSMAQPHTAIGDNKDDYHVFVIPTNFAEDREIACIEFRPDNKKAVHHALIGFDTSGKAQQKDDQTPGYGYFSFGDFGVNEAVYLSWGYVPGDIPLVFPQGVGEVIPAGADLLIQVHYAPLPTDEEDQSTLNIFFKDEADPIEREVKTGWTLPDNLPAGWFSFFIPANTVKTFTAENFSEDMGNIVGANYDVSLIGVQPHSHLLGKAYEVWAETPAGEIIPIISIPEYDFNWQGAYSMQKMLKIPANSTWYTKATYDNTVDNPSNPNNPPKLASWGEGTEDEMLVNLFTYVEYKEGDEDIDLGAGIMTNSIKVNPQTNSSMFVPSPNPTSGNFDISFYLEKAEDLAFELYDLNGQLVQTVSKKSKWESGFHKFSVENTGLRAGTYIINMVGTDYYLTQQLIVIR